jgi:hypothetical protein
MFLKIYISYVFAVMWTVEDRIQIVAGSSKDLAIQESRMLYVISLPKTIDKTLLRAEVGS